MIALLLACRAEPWVEARAGCGLAEGETRPFAELATVPDDACAARLLTDVGYREPEGGWAEGAEGYLRVAEALWALAAGDWGPAEADPLAPAGFVADLEDLPGWGEGPLSRPLYTLVARRVRSVSALDIDRTFRYDRRTGDVSFGGWWARGDPEVYPTKLVHAIAHDDPDLRHYDCLEGEWVEEGPDAAWGGAASVELWLRLRLYEHADADAQAVLGPRLAAELGAVCDLSTVPSDAWARMGVELL